MSIFFVMYKASILHLLTLPKWGLLWALLFQSGSSLSRLGPQGFCDVTSLFPSEWINDWLLICIRPWNHDQQGVSGVIDLPMSLFLIFLFSSLLLVSFLCLFLLLKKKIPTPLTFWNPPLVSGQL